MGFLIVGVILAGSVLAAVPAYVLDWIRRDASPVLFHVDTRARSVALTIDDGPSDATGEILDILAEFDVRATFFVIGEQVRAHPELVRRLLAEGHELGHHMMVDQPSIDLPPETFRDRFEEMAGILDELGGSRFFRPASGWYDDRMVDEAASRGYRTVLGSVYPFDAQLPFPTFASWFVRSRVGPGSIVVLHDGPARGLRTARVLRDVLPDLLARGYRVVGLSELTGAAG
ncbi:MAG: chitin deacetylase family protein [Gemmatimonadota bacterium]